MHFYTVTTCTRTSLIRRSQLLRNCAMGLRLMLARLRSAGRIRNSVRRRYSFSVLLVRWQSLPVKLQHPTAPVLAY